MCWVMSVGGQSARQAHQHHLERLDAAGRRADAHDLSGRAMRTRPRCARRGAVGARRMPTRARAARLHLGLQLGGEPGHAVGDVAGRLGDEIDGADLERLERDLGAGLGQRRDHHDRHRPQRHDLAQERHAVHVRHLDVERDDVGIERLDPLARDMGIGRRADHLDLGIGRQQRRQQLPHHRGVVDDENPYRCAHVVTPHLQTDGFRPQAAATAAGRRIRVPRG